MFNLKNKKIAVFGMGVSGLSALRFVDALDGDSIAINSGEVNTWSKTPSLLDFVKISDCFSENDPLLNDVLNTIDLVILSPGISRDHKILKPLLAKNIPVWGEIELAYRYLYADAEKKLSPIIGITGTNGKTTTTTFLGEMIVEAGRSVFVGGNIGVPFCNYAFDVLKNKKHCDFILLELSSFQLESIDHFKVNIGMILNLFQNHGERYASFEDYGRAKFHLSNRMSESDVLIYPEEYPLIKAWAENITSCKKIVLRTTHPEIKYNTSEFKLPGIHNKVNLTFVIAAAETIGLSREAIQRSINTFGGVHHRIEYVSGVQNLTGYKVFNDAKSTNWDATTTAVTAMLDFNLPIILILGGKKRGHGDSILPFLDFLKVNVVKIYLIGEMADEIETEINGIIDYKKTVTLEATIHDLRLNYATSKYKEVVLLFSPAFPSFDQFNNYAHRGEHFIKLLTYGR